MPFLTCRQEVLVTHKSMSALPPEHMRALQATAEAVRQPLGSLVLRWDEMHDQAARLAELAKVAQPVATLTEAQFVALLQAAPSRERQLVWQGVEDIGAMLQPGLVALGTLKRRGQDTAIPAAALWQEFVAARDGLIDILRKKMVSASAQ
jgi:hypothetical protein